MSTSIFLSSASLLILFFLLIISLSFSIPTLVLAASSSASPSCTFASQRTTCGQLTCNVSSGECVPCSSADECFNPSMTCTLEGKCQLMELNDFGQKHLSRLIGGVALAISTCSIAVIGGVGGGGILSGGYKIILGFALTDAVALSQATIAGTQITNMFLQTRRHHPKYQPPGATRPLINYQLLVLYVAPTLGGTAIGNLIGHIIADPVRLMIMVLFFAFLLSKTIKKVRAQREKDMKALQGKEEHEDEKELTIENQEELHEIKQTTNEEEEGEEKNDSSHTTRKESLDDKLLGEDLENRFESPRAEDGTTTQIATLATETGKFSDDHMDQFPLKMYLLIIAVFVPIAVSNHLKTVVVRCDNNEGGFWAILICMSIYCALFFYFYRRSLAKIDESSKKKEVLAEMADATSHEIQLETAETTIEETITIDKKKPQKEHKGILTFSWSDRTSILFPIIGIFGGMMSSLAGIGIGMLTSLLFIEAKITPEEMSATSGAATFLISVLTLSQFLIQGYARWDYSLLFMACGFVSTSIGQLVMMPEIKKRGLKLLILLALASIMLGSLLMSLGVGISATIAQINDGGAATAFGFGNYCPEAHKDD